MAYKKKLVLNDCSSASAFARLVNLPIEEINACKQLNCPLFPATGRYYLTRDGNKFFDWYNKNKDKIDEYLETNPDAPKSKTKSEWKERKERAQALIAEMDLRDRQEQTLDKNKVISFLKRIEGSRNIMVRSKEQELPHRLLGKSLTEMGVILSKSNDEICNLFLDALEKEKWNVSK